MAARESIRATGRGWELSRPEPVRPRPLLPWARPPGSGWGRDAVHMLAVPIHCVRLGPGRAAQAGRRLREDCSLSPVGGRTWCTSWRCLSIESGWGQDVVHKLAVPIH